MIFQRELDVIEDRLEYLIIKSYKTPDFCIVNNQIKTSIYNFANYAKDCLPVKNIKRVNILNKIFEIVDNFFCFKDGDRLLSELLFISSFILIVFVKHFQLKVVMNV